MEIRTDRRLIETHPDPAAERAFRSGHRAVREDEIVTSRALLGIHRGKVYVLVGCASAVEYAARDGMDRARAAELLRLGFTLETEPGAEEALRAGEVTPQALAEIGRLFRALGAEESGKGWLERAREYAPRKLREAVRRRLEEHAQQERRMVRLQFFVTDSVRLDFERARTLARRKAQKLLSDGQAFAALTIDYLEQHDPLLVPPGTRRSGPTGEQPWDRYVPAEVRRAVRRRSGDRCEYGTCGHGEFTEFAHVRTHAAGGDREVDNVFQACGPHHTLQEAGRIQVLEMLPEGPVFVVAQTGEIVLPRGVASWSGRATGEETAPPDSTVPECVAPSATGAEGGAAETAAGEAAAGDSAAGNSAVGEAAVGEAAREIGASGARTDAGADAGADAALGGLPAGGVVGREVPGRASSSGVTSPGGASPGGASEPAQAAPRDPGGLSYGPADGCGDAASSDPGGPGKVAERPPAYARPCGQRGPPRGGPRERTVCTASTAGGGAS